MSKFKVGDSVEVLFSATDMQELQETVGHSYKVSIVCDDKYQPYQLSNNWWYRECELKSLWPTNACNPVFNPYVKDPEELTQAELQFLIKYLSGELHTKQQDIKDHKEGVAYYWKLCDVDNNVTFGAFCSMNYNKDTVRYLQGINKKLSEIQRKLKKQAGK